MSTVADLFSQLGLTPWWEISPSQRFGGNNNGEWGEDFPMRPGTRVGSITAGKVVYVGQPQPGNSIGYVVQVESPDGSLTHYQHLQSATVHEGDTVAPGDVVGLSGGCPSGAYTSTACKWTDSNSTGPHIEVRRASGYSPSGGVWYQQWQDPSGQWNSLAGEEAGSTPADTSGGGSLSGVGGIPAVDPTSSHGCLHYITIPNVPGQNPILICLDSGLALLIRGGLVIAGVIFILAAIAIFAAGNKGVQTVAVDAAKIA